MADVVIGVDLGSSAARAIAIDGDGVVHAKSVASYGGTASWPEGRAEPAAWLDALGRAVADLGSSAADARRPLALAVSGQAPTTVAIEGGLAVTVLHPARAGLGVEDSQMAQLAVLADEAGAEREGAQIWDWVLARLGGRRCCGMWPTEGPIPGFGERVDVGTVVGHADGSHGVPEGTALVPGAQDAYMSFWAAGIDRAGRGHDPGGRTGGLGVAVDADARPVDMYSVPSSVEGVEIVGGPVNGHGQLLEWWASMSGTTIEEVLAAASEVPAGARGVTVLPYHAGERAPRWNADLTGEILGLRFDTGPAEVARAVLEAAAYGLAHIERALAADGVGVDVVVAGGSPARSRLWCEIKASVLGCPVQVPEHPEQLAAYGAALAGGAALGWWPGTHAGGAGAWPRPRITEIDPVEDPRYAEGYERFVAAGDAAAGRLAAAPGAGDTSPGEPSSNMTEEPAS